MKNLPLTCSLLKAFQSHGRLGTNSRFVIWDNVFVNALIIDSKNTNTCIVSLSVIFPLPLRKSPNSLV